MSRDQLIAELRRLRQGIREHRDASGHDLCWHHPQLWGSPPERIDPAVAVPPWPQFLRGCLSIVKRWSASCPTRPCWVGNTTDPERARLARQALAERLTPLQVPSEIVEAWQWLTAQPPAQSLRAPLPGQPAGEFARGEPAMCDQSKISIDYDTIRGMDRACLAHRGASSGDDPRRSKTWRPAMRLVTAAPGRPGAPPARQYDLAARSSLHGLRRIMPETETRPTATNRHGGAPRGARPAGWDARRCASAPGLPREMRVHAHLTRQARRVPLHPCACRRSAHPSRWGLNFTPRVQTRRGNDYVF